VIGVSENTFVGQIEAVKLASQLSGVEPTSGRFGPFYALDNYTFTDAAR